MAGVGGITKLVRQVLGNWKVGKNCQLVLNCDGGVMKVTMSADPGKWVQPSVTRTLLSGPSVTGDRGHQGPRRRAGPSYLRRQEKRAAARAAAPALGAVEAVTAPAAEQATTVSAAGEAITAPETAVEKAATAPEADQAEQENATSASTPAPPGGLPAATAAATSR